MILRNGVALLRIALVFWLLTVPLSACDPGADTVFVNPNAFMINVFAGENESEPEFSLSPGESRGVAIIRQVWTGVLIARDPDGRIIHEYRATWKEFERADRIVFSARD